MSERTRGSHVSGSRPEAHDLTELHASKTADPVSPTSSEPANTDLASASIQSINVVRLSSRPEKRPLSSLNLATSTDVAHTTEQKIEQRPTSKRGEKHGILNNPYFPYKGGPLERFITLLANLVRYLEKSLLAALQDRPSPVPVQKPVIKTKKKGVNGEDVEDEDALTSKIETPHRGSPR
ncbi:MAG: hypothetical protein RL518_1893 [Pseudomonadota bacterium]